MEFLPGNNDQLALVDVVGVKRKINIGLHGGRASSTSVTTC